MGDYYDVKQFVNRFIPLMMLKRFALLRADSKSDFACTSGCPFQLSGDLITRNEVTFLYVLLECFKWISTYFKANNAINPYNIDSL